MVLMEIGLTYFHPLHLKLIETGIHNTEEIVAHNYEINYMK